MHRQTRAELRTFTDWLRANNAEGYIGETGWPGDVDVDRWNQLAAVWYTDAEASGLWVDVWGAGEWWGSDYTLSPFVAASGRGGVDSARPSGELIASQARTSDFPRGVTVSGGEFGAPGSTDRSAAFSNENSGEYGVDYHYDSQATFDYLATQGLDTVRLPFRWERIQPELGAPLDTEELQRLRDAVGRAHEAGLEVILDVHNYGAYFLSNGERGLHRPLGSSEVTNADFADLWQRISETFEDVPGVVAYGLMNEPVGLEPVAGLTPPQVWERASQEALDAIRGNDDDTLVMVAGYEWSHARHWDEQHPDAWIEDPAESHRYEAHHYWLRDYENSYDDEVAAAEAAGW